MIISPPFLPASGLTSDDAFEIDSMMAAVANCELAHGIYPVAFDRRWHTGVHLMPDLQNERVRAVADGEVIAYRVCQKAIDGGSGRPDSNAGFVLLKHKTETGEGRLITFYSLYMHLLELDGYKKLGVSLDGLPDFLQTPSPGEVEMLPVTPPPAQSGNGRKVYRKDALGLVGRCHGQNHLHFEIFMLPDDFDAYFGGTQLDKRQPKTQVGSDCWGHVYYIIPPEQTFFAKPPNSDSKGKVTAPSKEQLKDVTYPILQDGKNSQCTLHVEVYFHKGDKFTNVWSVAQDGTRTLLTTKPVQESGYEYELVNRARVLYPDCPSDGYELLRFGRILSSQPTLAVGAARATWTRITFASGREGYIDINSDAIVKLSDADFPYFMGWKRVSKSDNNMPYDNDGMCDVDELKKVVNDVAAATWLPEEPEDEDFLSEYIKSNDALRAILKGFVCHAPTEWDSGQNEKRYAALNGPDGFYGRQKELNPIGTGYADFLDLLKKFQFWDKTGLPSGELWFFHPLEFIRHFRKCGWMQADEMAQCFPRTHLRLKHTNFVTESVAWSTAYSRAKDWVGAFNRGARKYGLDGSKLRLLHFLAHVIPETASLSLVVEGGAEHASYAPYWGRGLIQLTHLGNYLPYGKFRKFQEGNAPKLYKDLGWDPDELIAKDNKGHRNTENCVDSSCFYIANRGGMLGHMDAGCGQADAIIVSKDVNGYVAIENLNGLDVRLQSVIYLRNILLDDIFDAESVPVVFEWRRSSDKEPKRDAQGNIVKHGDPPKDVMMYYKTTHTIQAPLARQRP